METGIQKVKDYAMMQAIKETSTIRQSPKGSKPMPRIVFRYGSQDRMIRLFLDHRRWLNVFLKKNAGLKLPDYCPDLDCFVRHLDEKKPCEESCFWMLPQIEEVN